MKTLVLYDDECAFCRGQVRLLTRLDWLRLLAPLPASAPEAVNAAPGLTREALLEAVHCVTPGGRVYRAARAYRQLMLRVPLLAPLGLLLWVPGLIGVAETVYRWVARNRAWLSRILGYK